MIKVLKNFPPGGGASGNSPGRPPSGDPKEGPPSGGSSRSSDSKDSAGGGPSGNSRSSSHGDSESNEEIESLGDGATESGNQLEITLPIQVNWTGLEHSPILVKNWMLRIIAKYGQIGRAVQQECRDRSRMPSSA
eukprot:TRINITY_DN8768_c0_g1_i6.p1 TRINITY_DN8768_c0_g1~~TRINITY_DN8768_c0_g1_i6.p1  ORF type:complete len:135 (+),score=12.13 TRINITY_DN8768_c0_g1_i6:84-488(+)